MNSIIVSHESDVDGVFSASIALMRYPQSKLVFSSYGKDNFLRISDLIYKEVVSTQGNGLVIFTDLGLNDESISSISDIFNFLMSNSWSVLWIDHHPWSEGALDLFNKDKDRRLVLDRGGNKCASELMYEHLLFENNNRWPFHAGNIANSMRAGVGSRQSAVGSREVEAANNQ